MDDDPVADVVAWWQYLLLTLYYIALPFIWLIEQLLTLLAIVLAPFLHVLSYALYAVLIPLRLLAKLETLYIFFGTAVVLGLTTGLFLYLFTALISPVLGLRSSTRTAAIDSLSAIATDDEVSAGEEAINDDYDYDRNGDDNYSAITPPRKLVGLSTGRTAASFNAERAEKRAKRARQQALLGLPVSSITPSGGIASATSGKLKGKPKTKASSSAATFSRSSLPAATSDPLKGRASNASSSTKNGGGSGSSSGSIVQFEDSDWAAAREMGPPTPMMGTMILEEDDSWSE